jgi:hypothetical protein
MEDRVMTLKDILEKATKGPWMAVPLGGASTVIAQQEPARNDRRIPAYPHGGCCISYPDLDDVGGRAEARWEYTLFSHADAALIALAPDLAQGVLDAIGALEGIMADGVDELLVENIPDTASTSIDFGTLRRARATLARLKQIAEGNQ